MAKIPATGRVRVHNRAHGEATDEDHYHYTVSSGLTYSFKSDNNGTFSFIAHEGLISLGDNQSCYPVVCLLACLLAIPFSYPHESNNDYLPLKHHIPILQPDPSGLFLTTALPSS
jgi:hypothetical protein